MTSTRPPLSSLASDSGEMQMQMQKPLNSHNAINIEIPQQEPEQEQEQEQQQQQQKYKDEEESPSDSLEFVLFQVSECYVYMIPPRKSAASYRADEWNVNKWAWEGALKVTSKGEECIIKLEDKKTGELYARAFLRNGEPHPVEPVIDSSRYFVLRVEENIDGRLRHAFIGMGFRERTEAYDFQAALHDHMKYLNKKKTAEEMEEQYQKSTSVDYSLKEGETLVLKIKNKSPVGSKSRLFDQGLNDISLVEKDCNRLPTAGLKPLPPPPSPQSPVHANSPSNLSPQGAAHGNRASLTMMESNSREHLSRGNQSFDNVIDDDFGDFQTAT